MRIIHVDNDESLELYNSLINEMPAMVLFYMPGCGHCEMMKPEWEKFEKEISNLDNDLLVSRVRNDYIPKIEGSKDILGYPTIFKIVNGKKVDEFDEERNSEEFIKYLESMNPDNMKGGKRITKQKKTNKRKKSRKQKIVRRQRIVRKTKKINKLRKQKNCKKTKRIVRKQVRNIKHKK
jgi:thiol-disulfide isomerase/thioredoxin